MANVSVRVRRALPNVSNGKNVRVTAKSPERVTRARFSALLSPAEICSLWIVLFLLIALARMAVG